MVGRRLLAAAPLGIVSIAMAKGGTYIPLLVLTAARPRLAAAGGVVHHLETALASIVFNIAMVGLRYVGLNSVVWRANPQDTRFVAEPLASARETAALAEQSLLRGVQG
eukprot:CAMPEP_0181404048 /NCGR_PEP_ID=MMETSP1110-20121109/4038_1 /TAXON_ID=174948 /ORGANISM="Symbiodinium sp., Strain CCMP421" /LENGTH=108 /DNA_ID=CAMNT_0023526383 /DNA_START=56 /DNA_END=381 /DNA_ORIENTATION=+